MSRALPVKKRRSTTSRARSSEVNVAKVLPFRREMAEPPSPMALLRAAIRRVNEAVASHRSGGCSANAVAAAVAELRAAELDVMTCFLAAGTDADCFRHPVGVLSSLIELGREVSLAASAAAACRAGAPADVIDLAAARVALRRAP